MTSFPVNKKLACIEKFNLTDYMVIRLISHYIIPYVIADKPNP